MMACLPVVLRRPLSTSSVLRLGKQFDFKLIDPSKRSPKVDFIKPHHGGGMKLWKNLTFFMALPACVILSINVYLQHQKEHECHVRPEFIPYDHLNIRTKRFPWGDGNHSFFFNKHTQPGPNGYEDDDEH